MNGHILDFPTQCQCFLPNWGDDTQYPTVTARTKGFNANQIMSFHVFIFLNGCFLYLKSKTFLPWLTRPCAVGLCHPTPPVTFYTPDPEMISDALICQIHTRLGDFLLLSPLSATFCSAVLFCKQTLFFRAPVGSEQSRAEGTESSHALPPHGAPCFTAQNVRPLCSTCPFLVPPPTPGNP